MKSQKNGVAVLVAAALGVGLGMGVVLALPFAVDSGAVVATAAISYGIYKATQIISNRISSENSSTSKNRSDPKNGMSPNPPDSIKSSYSGPLRKLDLYNKANDTSSVFEQINSKKPTQKSKPQQDSKPKSEPEADVFTIS